MRTPVKRSRVRRAVAFIQRLTDSLSKEQKVLHEHGVCYSCNADFLDLNCTICLELKRLSEKKQFKLIQIQPVGPTRLTRVLMDGELSDLQHHSWILRERQFTCPMYRHCLDFAAEKRWISFTCRWCLLRTETLLVRRIAAELLFEFEQKAIVAKKKRVRGFR